MSIGCLSAIACASSGLPATSTWNFQLVSSSRNPSSVAASSSTHKTRGDCCFSAAAAERDRVELGAVDGRRRCATRSARYMNAEGAAAPGFGSQRERRVENGGDTLADRQAEPESLLAPRRGLIQPAELLENRAAIFRRDARTGVGHLQLDHRSRRTPARAEQHTAGGRVAQCVADEVLQDAS